MVKFICFEGSDGLGKTTQAILLEEKLLSLGYKVKYFKFPSKSFLGNLIYKMLNSGLAKKNPNIFQTINYFDKLYFQIKNMIISKYDYIILDRWKLSSIVYGSVSGANEKYLEFISRILKEPDITFLFFGDNFLLNKIDQDSFEKDNNLQNLTKKKYIHIGLLNKNTKFINANNDIEKVTQEIINICQI
jgi:thymidylate kinase